MSRGGCIFHYANLFGWRSGGLVSFSFFAMAVAFWLGRDRRLVKAMLVSIGLGMLVMGGINVVELVLVGQVGGRSVLAVW